jgi:ubiquinone/menaquinone biosynthesis C-methylase UbiE
MNKNSLLNLLICPKCDSKIIKEGNFLNCSRCNAKYPIFENVPILLANFREKDFNKTKKSFSREWSMFSSGEKTWIWNLEERKRLFIQELELKRLEDLKGKVILDAGCGNGQLTSILSNYCRIIGMDLSQSVFGAEKRKGEISKHFENIKFIEGNIINPPLKKKSFDIIYSSGVLHHTPSTYDSFKSLIPLLKKNGKYYIYLYRKDRKDETLITYLAYRFREITKYLPLGIVGIITAILAPFEKFYADITTELGIRKSVRRTIKEHSLSLYDHLSPRYAYRHTIPEVKKWFENYGFKAQVVFEDRNGFGILGSR